MPVVSLQAIDHMQKEGMLRYRAQGIVADPRGLGDVDPRGVGE